ncbi:uncharacterized protein BYT42DRAFT_617439 [Radiomyces spectabilis]|uniref:uncharacterized protein n=1 Tax=Radiomyces spectabilis TaxID=64574 RepID=UPI00221E99E0|nr:uncharacterized protein BYT42DRAFT_617439 [Radiomyces spectabilis]KAI8369408.1 hypothetical protein BYT42DRAFT_617439 [Radiomyces spectabilis]
MSRLTQTPPLISIRPSRILQVERHVDDPILPQRENKQIRLALSFLDTFARLEFILSKVDRLEKWQLQGNLKDATGLMEHLQTLAEELVITIQSLWNQCADKEQLVETLDLKRLYPRGCHYLLLSNKHQDLTSTTDVQAHYFHMALLNQIYATAFQVLQGLNLKNHKYIPYQLALLYQCVNQQEVKYQAYALRIEEQFSEIKSHTKRHDVPLLTEFHITWLQKLAQDIIEQVMQEIQTGSTTKMGEVAQKLVRLNKE